MSGSYQHVVKGGLKLKGGGGLPTAGGVKKKKKKKHKEKEREQEALELAAGDEDAGGAVPPPPRDNRTAAERRYDEQMEKNQAKIVEKMASKSHRDKVRDFNEYLSKLSEHHDIPKVGPG